MQYLSKSEFDNYVKFGIQADLQINCCCATGVKGIRETLDVVMVTGWKRSCL